MQVLNVEKQTSEDESSEDETSSEGGAEGYESGDSIGSSPLSVSEDSEDAPEAAPDTPEHVMALRDAPGSPSVPYWA